MRHAPTTTPLWAANVRAHVPAARSRRRQLYLPKSVEHESKTKKIVNCGAVGFTLQAGKPAADGSRRFKIEPDSIKVIYGGFENKKKK